MGKYTKEYVNFNIDNNKIKKSIQDIELIFFELNEYEAVIVLALLNKKKLFVKGLEYIEKENKIKEKEH